MPEPLSIAASLWLGGAALHACARPRSGLSETATELAACIATLVSEAESSEVLFGRKSEAISKLRAMVSECSRSDWDGCEASAVNEVAVENVEAFLRILPDDMPMPEFTPEPDGFVSLDWIATRHRMLSVSVGPSNRLAMAWLDGSEKGHAVVHFDRMSLPSIIKERIECIISYADPSLRVA